MRRLGDIGQVISGLFRVREGWRMKNWVKGTCETSKLHVRVHAAAGLM
jgi:hypothetical protein